MSTDAPGRIVAGGDDAADSALTFLGLPTESDYGPLPPTKWSQPWSAASVRFWTTIGALVVGFLLTSAGVVGHLAASEESQRKDELVQLVHERQDRTDALSAQLDDLRARLDQLEMGASSRAAASLQSAVDQASVATGLTPVAGPGVRVTFSDAEDSCDSARPEDCRIQDTDLQLALNELWALGAEAIAVNGERVIATTAVRNAGSAVLVNYRVLTSPYIVEAVGDPRTLREQFLATEVATDFASWQSTFKLGFGVEEVQNLELPAYAGAVQLDTGTNIDPTAEQRT